MTKQFTEDKDDTQPPFPPTSLRSEFRARLLASMEAEQAIARAARLAPAAMSPAFRQRLLKSISSAPQRPRRFVSLRWQYGAAASVVLCAMVGSLFCIAPQEGHTSAPTLRATASRGIRVSESGSQYYDTMTVVAADNTVLRVRSLPCNLCNLPEDVI